MDASASQAAQKPPSAATAASSTLRPIMRGSRSVSRYAAAGGATISATTSTDPTASKAPTAVMETSVMKP